MKLIYGSPMSQPTRFVMWTARLQKTPFKLQNVNSAEGEHRSSDFLAMNPNAVFPVLKDESGFVLHESNAIAIYLCGNGSDLYPADSKTRALIHQWLDWKHGALREGCAGVVRRRVMHKLMKDISHHSMSMTFKEVKEEREVRLMKQSLEVLNKALKSSGGLFIIPNTSSPTLADLAIFEEVEQLSLLPPGGGPVPDGSDLSAYPQIVEWQARMRKVEGYEDVHKPFLGALKKLAEMRKKSAL